MLPYGSPFPLPRDSVRIVPFTPLSAPIGTHKLFSIFGKYKIFSAPYSTNGRKESSHQCNCITAKYDQSLESKAATLGKRQAILADPVSKFVRFLFKEDIGQDVIDEVCIGAYAALVCLYLRKHITTC